MKVHGSDPLSRLRDLLARSGGPEAAAGLGGPHGSRHGEARPADSVQLSPEAQELARLREALAASPELREEFVHRLRDEIASGEYRIDGTRIADAMLSEDAELAALESERAGDE